jgi:hypothetical protein
MIAMEKQVLLLERIYDQVANVLVGILVFVAVVLAIPVTTLEGEDVVTNIIQVGIIVGVIV